MSHPKKVIVGMSGGVDSSVAAWLLLQEGYEVEGLFMKNWEEDDGTEYCTALTDLADAQQVADTLGIRLHTANFAAEYWDRVFEYFLAEYKGGRTPNPDILCNKEIKFRAFLDYALTLGADAIATGHYATRGRNTQTEGGGEIAELCKGVDSNKDQSYFLHAVSGKQLAKTLFPLGKMLKPEVRRIAKEQGFTNHAKKDSTGICFIGERRFRDFLQQYIPAQPGQIVSESGAVVGEHQGLMYYTIGQRQGIGIGGIKDADENPWYVLHKDLDKNQLLIGQGNDHPRLFSRTLNASRIEWVSGKPPSLPLICTAKTRYRQPDQSCTVSAMPHNPSLNAGHEPFAEAQGEPYGISVHFDEPQRAVTPGQYVVFYQGDVCLGGGPIESTHS
ncbi:Probable tRNA 5-methylaminomethyl-2-thiouridylate-methyltransferase [gamma proteobacterium HdN1]|nr:Probable tRNA 5-methylaminomethyl-2-thiouridylate-methyltransferase [gamma proteobacterium HdN1]